MAEHHFIVKFDDETEEWSIDADSEETRFPDGTIWDEIKQEWTHSYQGEGNFYSLPDGSTSDDLDSKFSSFIARLN